MTRLLALFLAISFAFALPARAEENDSLFADYGDYNAYVDRMLTSRNWAEFVKRMGGRDEYDEEQLAKIQADFDRLFPNGFAQRTVFREVDLGGGIKQEARAYWGRGRYLFYYAILHVRDDDLVVLNFSMNTRVEAIMDKF